jgi:hypothetical protein
VYKHGVRRLFCLIVIAGVPAQGVMAQTIPQPQRTIPCSEIIDFTPFPYYGSPNRRDRSRLVLESVMAPRYLPHAYPTRETPWRYFSKQGLVVKSGTSVTITVPVPWRRRVGVVWGNAGHGIFHTIRIAACGSNPKRGNAYAGGFFLSRSSACVPLVFIVGTRREKVWLGIGQRCR